MKVTFVFPNMSAHRAADAMEPLVFALLKSLTPPEVEVAYYDDRLEEVPTDEPTDLVAMSLHTFGAKRGYAIADAYRRRGVKVVMGGFHPTLLPEEALAHADAVVLGDAEPVWPEVLADAAAGRLSERYQADDWPPLAGIVPDRSIFGGKRYQKVHQVQFARGCRYACDFCSVQAFYHGRLRFRPVGDVLRELATLEHRLAFFVDDNFFNDEDRARALMEGMVPLGIRWACQISVDVAGRPELVRLMAKSGCISVLVGFESLKETNLRQMRKAGSCRRQSYEEAVRVFKRNGIMILGTWLFGYDDDTPGDFERVLAFAKRHRFFLSHFNPLMPTPKTALYERLEREGRLIDEPWWLHPDYYYGKAMFHPKGMTAFELEEGCFRAKQRFNTLGSILWRALDPLANCRSPRRLMIYLAANAVSRLEIRRKQGRAFGPPQAAGGAA